MIPITVSFLSNSLKLIYIHQWKPVVKTLLLNRWKTMLTKKEERVLFARGTVYQCSSCNLERPVCSCWAEFLSALSIVVQLCLSLSLCCFNYFNHNIAIASSLLLSQLFNFYCQLCSGFKRGPKIGTRINTLEVGYQYILDNDQLSK